MFRFASLQGEYGQNFIKERNIDTTKVDSIILVEPGTAYYVKSTAALEIMRHFGGLWPSLAVFKWVPEGFRNIVYDFIARNRYKWFGKKDQCMVPSLELKTKFLD